MTAEERRASWIAVFACLLSACGAPSTPPPPPVQVVDVATAVPEAPAASGKAPEEEPRRPRQEKAPALPPPGDREATDNIEELAHARQLFKEGVVFFDQGDYARARDKFVEAYRISPKAGLLLNAATAEQKLGNKTAACGYVKLWLKSNPSPADATATQQRFSCP